MLSDRARYLSPLNFATNFVFLPRWRAAITRGSSPPITGARTAPGTCASGAGSSMSTGKRLARMGRAGGPARTARSCSTASKSGARFNLPEFTGQLFIHATGIAGHDVVKYALDTYGDGGGSAFLHARRQFLARRLLCRPARARRGRGGGALAAEQPALRDTGGRDPAKPHGPRRSRAAQRAGCAVRDPAPERCGAFAGGALAAAGGDRGGEICGAPALRGVREDGPAAHRACECRADRS